MDCNFEYVLLDRKMINEFLRVLHRPEPSGYGTLPPEQMNTAWGVFERNTGITLTKAYETKQDPGKWVNWKWVKGSSWAVFDVMSEEGCFNVQYEINSGVSYIDSAKVYGRDTVFFTDKYLETAKKAIIFYEFEGNKDGTFDKFCQQFESSHKMSIDSYKNQAYKEVYDEWDKKWPKH